MRQGWSHHSQRIQTDRVCTAMAYRSALQPTLCGSKQRTTTLTVPPGHLGALGLLDPATSLGFKLFHKNHTVVKSRVRVQLHRGNEHILQTRNSGAHQRWTKGMGLKVICVPFMSSMLLQWESLPQ
eukprot:1307203-Amphidinium_carterae.1